MKTSNKRLKGSGRRFKTEMVSFTPEPVHVDANGKRVQAATKDKPRVCRNEVRLLRAERFIELQVKGIPVTDIAAAHNLTPTTVKTEIKRGIEGGAVEKVRERLQKQLDKIPNIYAEILDLDTKDTKVSEMALKIQTLRLKAAKQLADGLGPFQKSGTITTKTTETVDLDEFYKLRAARAGEFRVIPPVALPPMDAEVTEVTEPHTDATGVEEASDEQKSMGE